MVTGYAIAFPNPRLSLNFAILLRCKPKGLSAKCTEYPHPQAKKAEKIAAVSDQTAENITTAQSIKDPVLREILERIAVHFGRWTVGLML